MTSLSGVTRNWGNPPAKIVQKPNGWRIENAQGFNGSNMWRPTMPASFASLRVAANSAVAPASRAASVTYDSARGQDTVTSQHNDLPLCHGTSVRPSGLFPSDRDSPMLFSDGNSGRGKATSIIIIIIIINFLNPGYQVSRGVWKKIRRKLSEWPLLRLDLSICLQGVPIKNNPLEKILHLRNCSRFFTRFTLFNRGGFRPCIQQIAFKYLVWFQNYNYLNLKVHFSK